MSDEFEISRRKALGALGTIGVASAGAGFGTTAYFSDTESFDGNEMVAGELDMKVDWTEHYSDWSDDEGNNVSVSMTDDSLGYGFPSAASSKLLYVDDKDQFLANTAIESFPDVDDDGRQDFTNGKDGTWSANGNTYDICSYDADLDGVLGDQFRTDSTPDGIGGDPNPQVTAPGDPLINIADIKPGDFGEVTFSFHLCGNPGWVWLTGELVDADENGTTEPEAKDPDEIGPDEDDPQNRKLFDNEGDESNEENADPANTVQEPVELLDAIAVAVWYDTGSDGTYGEMDGGEGDNYHQDGEAFVPLVGSLRSVLQILEGGMVPLDFTPIDGDGTVTVESDSTTFDVCTDASGATVLQNDDLGYSSAKNVSCERLDDDLVDGGYVETGTEYVGTKIESGALQVGTYTAGNGGVVEVESVDVGAGTVRLSTNVPVEVVTVKGGNEGANFYVFEDHGGTEDDGVDEQFGCLLDSVQFSTPDGQAISHIELCYDPNIPSDGGDDGDGGDGDRECFPNSTTGYLGFEWWLPVDHANEIQGDSVAFDVGFYTEQCRHNDGKNPMPPDN